MSGLGELNELLERLDSASADLAAFDFSALSGDELAEVLPRMECSQSRLDYAKYAAARAFDDSKAWHGEGFVSASSWLQAETHLPKKTAQSRTRVAKRLLRSMPQAAAALKAGDIGREHVEALARVNRPELQDQFAEVEDLLVDNAKCLEFAAFERTVRHFEDLAEPDLCQADAETKLAARTFHASKTLDDRMRLDGWLDPVGGAEFGMELNRLEQDLFEQDWAEARARIGPKASHADLARTPTQRRADALVLMARRSANLPVGTQVRPPRTEVVLTMDWQTFVAELAMWENADPNAARPWVGPLRDRLGDYRCETLEGVRWAPSQVLSAAMAGHVRRIVFGSVSCVLDFGRSRRLATGALRKAIQVRDRHCVEPGCDVPAGRCHVDHRPEWTEGGHTAEPDLATLCGRHNRHKEHQRQQRKRGAQSGQNADDDP